MAEDKTFPASALYVSFFNIAITYRCFSGGLDGVIVPGHLLYIVAGTAIGLSILLVADLFLRALRQNILAWRNRTSQINDCARHC